MTCIEFSTCLTGHLLPSLTKEKTPTWQISLSHFARGFYFCKSATHNWRIIWNNKSCCHWLWGGRSRWKQYLSCADFVSPTPKVSCTFPSCSTISKSLILGQYMFLQTVINMMVLHSPPPTFIPLTVEHANLSLRLLPILPKTLTMVLQACRVRLLVVKS